MLPKVYCNAGISCAGPSKSLSCMPFPAHAQDILLMVGPYGDWVKYSLEERALLVTELDGVRLLGSCRHELLRRVPDALADVFRVGSTAPGPHAGCLAASPGNTPSTGSLSSVLHAEAATMVHAGSTGFTHHGPAAPQRWAAACQERLKSKGGDWMSAQARCCTTRASCLTRRTRARTRACAPLSGSCRRGWPRARTPRRPSCTPSGRPRSSRRAPCPRTCSTFLTPPIRTRGRAAPWMEGRARQGAHAVPALAVRCSMAPMAGAECSKTHL